MKPIIIFGTGSYGLRVIKFFGINNIAAITDNECKSESSKYGVRYIPFCNYYNEFKDCILIVAMNTNNALNVIEQLCAYNVTDFVVTTDYFWDMIAEHSQGEVIGLLNNTQERLMLERNQNLDILNIRSRQLHLLRKYTDVTKVKQLNGYARYIQNKLIIFTKKLFDDIRVLDIKPFLVGGSLLGYYRHGGFIPWDDDLDFGLLRDDYNRLISFVKEKYHFIEIGAAIGTDDNSVLESLLKKYPNEYIAIVSPNCLQIKSGVSEMDCNVVDFFSYDYYAKDYSFNNHINLLETLAKQRYEIKGNSVLCNIMYENNIIVNESDYIYFGIDNLDSFICKNTEWISRDIILPLKPIQYEKIPCFLPNDPAKLLEYYYKDYMTIPDDLTCQHLQEKSEMILKNDYVHCIIYVTDVCILKKAKLVYDRLRQYGIYSVFLVDWFNKCIEKELDDNEVEYYVKSSHNCDIEITDDIIKDDIYFNANGIPNNKFWDLIRTIKLSDKKRSNLNF